jgi:uncharacterized protein (TIGR00369 family)
MDPIDDIDRRSRHAVEVPLLRFLGASLLDRADGPWSIGLTPGPETLNAVAGLHGGAIATVLEVAAYLAVVPHLTTEEEAITIAFSASYIAAAPPDQQLRASGRLIRRTRALAFVTVELRGDGELLALASVTKAIRVSS